MFWTFISPKAHAQTNFAAEVRIDLDPSQFGLEGLSPAPSATGLGQVFGGSSLGRTTIIIRQWTDGTINVATPTKVESYDSQTGQTATTTYTATAQIPAGTVFSTSGTSTSTQTNTVTANVVNSLSFMVQGNLLIAVVECTVNGIKYGQQQVSLGIITTEGGFVPFRTGLLEGKDIIVGSPVVTISQTDAPGKTTAGKRGNVNSSSIPIYADVLAGYWVTVATINGVVVNISVDPIYSRQLVGFKTYTNPYGTPNGGELLK